MYRRTRTLPAVVARLRASSIYLRKYPNGSYSREVRSWFERVELAYFQSVYDSKLGLRRYLEALPAGPHKEHARRRLAELELVDEYASKRERALVERARNVEQRLERASQERRRFLVAFSDWLTRIASIREWNDDLNKLDPSLLGRFGDAAKNLGCTQERCETRRAFLFSVPKTGGLATRLVQFDVVLSLDQGRLEQAEIIGKDLFLRLAEASLVKALSPADGREQVEAIGQALQVMDQALMSRLPSEQCDVSAISPIILERRCHGMELKARVGIEKNQPDVIEIAAIDEKDASSKRHGP